MGKFQWIFSLYVKAITAKSKGVSCLIICNNLYVLILHKETNFPRIIILKWIDIWVQQKKVIRNRPINVSNGSIVS